MSDEIDNRMPILLEDNLQKAIEDLIKDLIPYGIQTIFRISPKKISVRITEMCKVYTERKIEDDRRRKTSRTSFT